ncbi:MAG: aminotransferase class I/II-fold pyridoxal phosphate-dependent enzyme [Candidatus Omnitrophica bacterium]|nr:aminotransferase class I/II-fold pyridoxal phosphate-dependent enzyme [Candidatus Omnitrophota bacterium]
MIADRVKNTPPSGIREFFDLVLGMPEVISLGVGEPDFITPWRIREKAITALEEGYTSYTSNKGLRVLREGISRRIKKRYDISYDPDEEVLITVGVSEGLDLALRAVLNPGDAVVVVSPHYVAYPALVAMNHGKVLPLITTEQEQFKINPDRLERLLKKNPKAIILNYPSNPTGATYRRDELRTLWKYLRRKDTVVITDEAYEDISFDVAHTPFAVLDSRARDRTIHLSGFSKGCAMTGFRVGYACASQKFIGAMTKIHSFSMLCGPIVSQLAGIEALRTEKEIAQMTKAYRRRREFMVKELNRIGLPAHMPQGTFYCFPSVSATGLTAMEFAKRLLFEEKVAVVPGTAFGQEFGEYVRMSCANTLDSLKEAAIRIERFVGRVCCEGKR